MGVIEIAKDTLEIIERGTYLNSLGETIDVSAHVRRCIAATTYHEPESLAAWRSDVGDAPKQLDADAISFHNETTLVGARTLVSAGIYRRVGALNFASALTPGGRFLAGATAQEESLARSSALYASLVQCPDYYRFHHEQDDPLYSDRMIYSPACPVFKEDNGDYLTTPYCVDFLTSPAPYTGFVEPGDRAGRARLREIFMERGGKMLELFARMGCDALVLGAWGCGAFCNDPEMVAAMFRHYLGPEGEFENRFRVVRFSICGDDHELRNFGVFKEFIRGGRVQ